MPDKKKHFVPDWIANPSENKHNSVEYFRYKVARWTWGNKKEDVFRKLEKNLAGKTIYKTNRKSKKLQQTCTFFPNLETHN